MIVDLEVVPISENELVYGHTVTVSVKQSDATFRKRAEIYNLLKISYHVFNFVIRNTRHEILQ